MGPDEKAEQLAKRKRLEGFLAERPTLEQVQATLGNSGQIVPPELCSQASLDAALTMQLNAELAGAPPPSLDSGMPTLDAALADDDMQEAELT